MWEVECRVDFGFLWSHGESSRQSGKENDKSPHVYSTDLDLSQTA